MTSQSQTHSDVYGSEYIRLAGFDQPPLPAAEVEPQLDVIVIGGGQAGLSVGHHLAKRGLRFVILDAEQRVGDVWRRRWDSLRLFTPRHLDGLDGMRFPGKRDTFPTKDEMADYLEAYAAHFALPVKNNARVERLFRRADRFVAQTAAGSFEAAQVVVAIGSYQKARLPSFARELDPSIVQLHAADYRSPRQLQPGPVLLVGAGNSGAEIALDLVREHQVLLAGRDTGAVPFELTTWLGRNVLCKLLLRIVFHRLFSVMTPLGRKLRPKFISQGGPLIRTKNPQLSAAGVQRIGRIAGVRAGKPCTETGQSLDIKNVLFCTGFDGGLSFIDLPNWAEDGEPLQQSGVASNTPGLYFVGLHFQHAMSSGMIHGVGRDAQRIARAAQRYQRAHG